MTIHPLPEAVPRELLRGGVVVVIDLLRATTVIVHALGQGARAVVPTASVDEAHAAAVRWPYHERLLGGERQGVRIDGFDLDNSPFSYGADVVASRTIIFTTTNGTRAMRWADQAAEILIASFNNLTAVANLLQAETRPVHLLCAGTDHQISAEDLLVAGAITDRCRDQFSVSMETQIFVDFWRQYGLVDDVRYQTLRTSSGGRNLIELGYDGDIARACELDRFAIVPRLDPTTGEIR